ncbi:MAG: hypothetical protein M1511_06845 [Deltaproteobacteria bacterium]|nr:hypothetical protein [Deltaproteobacteria bacterium]
MQLSKVNLGDGPDFFTNPCLPIGPIVYRLTGDSFFSMKRSTDQGVAAH